ncbi:MAG: molybdopterin molybdotransferase MoeA [Deltaproteobacteria bacterium]|nr:molybdopterin molybdotransferase MoeA [Deltaproteobacteria bacterium]
MPTFEEARELILEQISPLGKERIPLSKAGGRVLAEDVVAPWDMPHADNSAMDGYAVRSEDCVEPSVLKVVGYHPAGGAVNVRVEKGCAVRIMTGAPLPEGGDAVVPLEETEESDSWVRIRVSVKAGAHVRYRGEDVRSNDRVLSAGTVLRPPEISMLASVGKVLLSVYRRPLVAVLSTGDELVEPGEPHTPGAIINSNTFSLAAALAEGGAEPVNLGIARDDLSSLREKLAEGFSADALITTAGVSMGDRDLVREALAEFSVREIFWKVAMRPGSPTAFGVRDGKPVFSLPGNPVSSLVTFEVFVRPALRKMMGQAEFLKPLVKATLKETVKKKEGRVQFLRVKIDLEEGKYVIRSAGDQKTGILKTMVHADGIALLPSDRTTFQAGDQVDVCLLYQRC